MTRPRLLDLFCGAGGAGHGYVLAGFDVFGVDYEYQPNYAGDDFMCWDAFAWLDRLTETGHLSDFDAIHASPPCQGYSTQTADKSKHRRLIAATRDRLIATELPYIIENVEGARREMINPVRLCGSSFGLDVRRHRYFEANWPLWALPCDHRWQTPRFRSLDMSMVRDGRLASVVGVHGHINYPGEFELRCQAMGIDWMTNDELVQAIPPAYTKWIGEQLLDVLEVAA